MGRHHHPPHSNYLSLPFATNAKLYLYRLLLVQNNTIILTVYIYCKTTFTIWYSGKTLHAVAIQPTWL